MIDVKIVAIIVLGVLEGIALALSIDGAFFLPVAAIIGGLAGYTSAQAKVHIVEAMQRNKKEQ
jgi:hypothetical protein